MIEEQPSRRLASKAQLYVLNRAAKLKLVEDDTELEPLDSAAADQP